MKRVPSAPAIGFGTSIYMAGTVAWVESDGWLSEIEIRPIDRSPERQIITLLQFRGQREPAEPNSPGLFQMERPKRTKDMRSNHRGTYRARNPRMTKSEIPERRRPRRPKRPMTGTETSSTVMVKSRG